MNQAGLREKPLGPAGRRLRRKRAADRQRSQRRYGERCAAVIAALCLLVLCGCGSRHTYPPVTDAGDLGGRRIGVNLAWSADYLLTGRNDAEVVRYNTTSEMMMALQFGQIDAAALERPDAMEVMRRISGLGISDQVVAADGLVFAVNNDRTDLLKELNEFIGSFDGSPEQQDLFERLNSNEEFEYHKVEETGGDKVLSVGLPTDVFPFSYFDFETGDYAGSDVEVLTRFANAYGYQLEFTPGVFTSIELGVEEGEFDMAIGCFCNVARTDAELADAFQMTEPYMRNEVVLVEVTDPDHLKILAPLE